MRTIVGIDPSLTSTGVAVLTPDGETYLHRIKSTGTREDTWSMRRERIAELTHRITVHVPGGAMVVIEGPAYGAQSGSVHDRAGLWWFVFDRLAARGCDIVVATPQQRMKYATGKGRAHKDEVIAATVKRYPSVPISGNDLCDAFVFAAIGARLDGRPLEATMPKANLAALDKLWPLVGKVNDVA